MLKVGAGKACLNPTQDLLPVPKKGGAHFEAVYDDMSCRAIAVESNGRKLMLLVFELLAPPAIEGLYREVAEATGFPEEDIIFAATHNHTAPSDCAMPHGRGSSPEELAFYEKYKEIERIAALEAAKQAVETMRPAMFGFGETLSYINTNRDFKTANGYWTEARNLEGYSDKTLAMLKFVDMDGKLIAAVANHGTHATCAFLMKDADHLGKTSGNFPGIACRFAEEHYGDGAVVIWTSGAAGNQNPVLSHGMLYEYSDGFATEVMYPDGVGYMQMEYMGRSHGADIVKGIDAIENLSERMPIRHVKKNVMLPAQRRTAAANGRMTIRMTGKGLRDTEKFPYGTVPEVKDFSEMVEPDPEHPVELKMELVELGDVAIVCAAAELYAQIGRDMKKASPYKNTMVLTHTHYEKAGYILDKSSKDYQVFQAFSSVIPGSSDELIIKNELDMFDEILEQG